TMQVISALENRTIAYFDRRRPPMTSFQNIVFAADFSDPSHDAFRVACSLAVEGRTRLHILHVIEPRWIPEDPAFLGQAGVQFYDASGDGAREARVRHELCSAYAPE